MYSNEEKRRREKTIMTITITMMMMIPTYDDHFRLTMKKTSERKSSQARKEDSFSREMKMYARVVAITTFARLASLAERGARNA